MAEQSIKEQIQENKKKLALLGAVVVFGAYMMWPGGGGAVEEDTGALDDQLAALQAERESGGEGGGGGSAPVFGGQDPSGISLGGGGGDVNDPGVFQTGPPLITGTLVGFGTKTDFEGEYLVSYISVKNSSGYEIDMRGIVGYSVDIPPYLDEGKDVRVYGEFTGPTNIKAKAIQ